MRVILVTGFAETLNLSLRIDFIETTGFVI